MTARDDDSPVTLADAASHFGFTVSTLRAEIARGNLTVYRIGRRLWTKPNDIRAMVQKCRVDPLAHGSISTRDERRGFSGTDESSSVRDALKLSVERLKSSSRNTSGKSTNRRMGQTR